MLCELVAAWSLGDPAIAPLRIRILEERVEVGGDDAAIGRSGDSAVRAPSRCASGQLALQEPEQLRRTELFAALVGHVRVLAGGEQRFELLAAAGVPPGTRRLPNQLLEKPFPIGISDRAREAGADEEHERPA